ncbi:MAG: hypothetical protein LBG64_00235, partial [Pseudomonadales bacterium]|nr:hypothetical protein [Pseudomonadales bacterium]
MNNNFEFATGLNSNIGNQFSGNATQNPTQQNVYQTQANNQMNGAQPTNNGFAADNDLTMGENYYEEKPSTFKKIILPLALIIIAVALIIWAITRIAQNGYEEVTVEMVDLEIEQMVVPITDEVNIEEIASVEEVGVTA